MAHCIHVTVFFYFLFFRLDNHYSNFVIIINIFGFFVLLWPEILKIICFLLLFQFCLLSQLLFYIFFLNLLRVCTEILFSISLNLMFSVILFDITHILIYLHDLNSYLFVTSTLSFHTWYSQCNKNNLLFK